MDVMVQVMNDLDLWLQLVLGFVACLLITAVVSLW